MTSDGGKARLPPNILPPLALNVGNAPPTVVRGGWVRARPVRKHVANPLLPGYIVLLQQSLVQPVGVSDTLHWIRDLGMGMRVQLRCKYTGKRGSKWTHPLHGCRNGDDFLHGAAETLNVVIPIQNLAKTT